MGFTKVVHLPIAVHTQTWLSMLTNPLRNCVRKWSSQSYYSHPWPRCTLQILVITTLSDHCDLIMASELQTVTRPTHAMVINHNGISTARGSPINHTAQVVKPEPRVYQLSKACNSTLLPWVQSSHKHTHMWVMASAPGPPFIFGRAWCATSRGQ
jgi:hypothetical protein